LFAPEEITPREPRTDELELAAKVAAYLRERFPAGAVRYARVDMLRDHLGEPVLLELELTEPSLFLWTDPTAPQRVAAAVRSWAAAD
ncbi:MAG: hypothetical protein ACKOYM_06350, partial [Actinomycetes bacterium]